MSNKSAKEKLIQLYGAECFIEKLHLRKDKNRHYKSKKQMKRMKQITYHHIRMKKDGGKSTVENGVLLSAENHSWFHKQPLEEQEKMNRIFQEYKKCKVELTDELPTDIDLHYGLLQDGKVIELSSLSRSERIERDRRKAKKEFQRVKKYWEDR